MTALGLFEVIVIMSSCFILPVMVFIIIKEQLELDKKRQKNRKVHVIPDKEQDNV